jgi:hypothetical protein
MKLPFYLLVFLFILATPELAATQTANDKCDFVQCREPGCGCELKKLGWKEIARCSGHHWSYVIEKKRQRKICQGVNARGGPKEDPCSKFDGRLSDFRKCADKSSFEL